jgi:hypothetical protein
MSLVRQRFRGESDLVEMQRLVRQRTDTYGPGTNLHPGDVAHRIYSGLRVRDLDGVVQVWGDVSGIAASGSSGHSCILLSPASVPEVDVLQRQSEVQIPDGSDDLLEVVAFLA